MINDPIESLPNTSVITIRRFKSININTYWDLLNYFPSRYEDYSIISSISKIQEGETVTVCGKILQGKFGITKRGTRIQTFKLEDNSGIIELTWFNQPYLLRLFQPGLTISVAGVVRRFGKKITLEPQQYEIGTPRIHTGGIIPVYPEKRGLSSKLIREKIAIIFNNIDHSIEEILPPEIIIYNRLIKELTAYKNIHFPDNLNNMERARFRLAFDELFIIQLTSKLIRNEWEKQTVGHAFTVGSTHVRSLQKFIDNLSFKLTAAQNRVWDEIKNDMTKSFPMNRFLQGEVGSGKTVVAALACYLTFLNGYQSLVMAPTEILAQQHYRTIINLFGKTLNICLITGSIKPKLSELKQANIIIGTHSLIQGKIIYDKVGLIVIDEQHRFGVSQRAKLKEKGINPHVLTMTATPIPRTVALTLHGELNLSIIDEMPVGRLPIKTYLVAQNKREACYRWIKKQINNLGVQVFVICPLIEESTTETLQTLKAATLEFETLQKKAFPELKIGLIHGKLKPKVKDQVMSDFKEKKYDILVATPVVEVGIDITNATIMLIEGAERFGLAQLHQLRGRVGRGNMQSYCYLFTNNNDASTNERLLFFTKTQEGRLLAEKDLSIRGAGNIYGLQQHGFNDLKIADLSDYTMIKTTEKAVEYFLQHLNINKFTGIKKRVAEYQIEEIARD